MTVSQDSASRVYCPVTAAEWTELLTGTGLSHPSSWWLCQETSGNLTDSGSGGRTVAVSGGPAYFQTATGWSRKGIKPTDASAAMFGTFTGSDVNTTSSMLLQMFSLNTPATAARGLNLMGTATPEHATLQSGNKLRATSNANTSDGVQQQAGVMIVITKFDRANSVLGVYTRHEQLKPTYAAPGASTTFYLFGNAAAASDATLVYGAYWSGATAEISDSLINDLLETLHGAETTNEKMQAGSFAHKWVVAIEGCPYLFSDAPSAAVLDAYAGRDWTQVHGGLFVELHNDQGITPMEVFTTTGNCTLRILDDGTDTLGTFIARRQGGDATTLTATVDRNDTTIPVKNTTEFSASGTVYIGTEAISYTGKTASSFTGCTRGLYSPFGTALSGTGGIRFGNHHRVGSDINHVQMNPVVSSIPRVWIGKRVSVRLHTWDAANSTINSRAEAQLMFAGRITAISDDHQQVGITVIEVEHAMAEFRNATIGKDLYHGEIAPGVTLITGRQFNFREKIYLSAGSVINNATALVVVAGAPVNTNQIKEGRYSLTELAEALSRWLAGEKTAGRIAGYHSFASPVSSSEGLRTRVTSNIVNATANVHTACLMNMPSEVFATLGIWADNVDSGSASSAWVWGAETGVAITRQGFGVPFTSLVFRSNGPLVNGSLDTSSVYLDAENERGTFTDNYSRLPSVVKAQASATVSNWGLFLIDEKVLVTARYDSANRRLRHCQIAPYQLAVNTDAAAMSFVGRRGDDDNQGPVTVRQVVVMEGTTADLFLNMVYGSGTSGYNHASFDSLGFGLGAAIPGELLGPEFERSATNLPSANAPIVVVVDEPIKFSELFGGDLQYRWAFLRWKDQHFEIKQWKTPLNALAVTTLNEANKAEPAGSDANYRVVSRETAEHQHSIIQIDSSRDFGFGRTGEYFRSYTIEDQTAVDDKGGGVSPTIIRLRNTFGEFAATGSSVSAGLGEFMAHMPSVSRVTREVERSMDHRYFEQLAPGDIVTVADDFARDPLTGVRGVNSRAGFVTRTAATPGGPTPEPGSKPSNIEGRVTVNFLDTQRGAAYAPTADIDETAGSGGYSAGYLAAGPTIRCHANHYSHVMTLKKARGTIYINEAADATHFEAGDKILIIERDPADPASPTYWERTVLSVSGNDITLTATLSAPAWNPALRYRILPQSYSQVQTTQREAVFQADDADEMVENVEIPWHYSVSDELWSFQSNTVADPGEFVPNLCYGDGRPYDVGHERSIAKTLNAFIDYKSAHQAPALSTQVQGNWSEAGTQWVTMFFGPEFFGTEHLDSSVSRVLKVAPWFRSRTGGTAKVRITIMASAPTGNDGGGFLPGEQFSNPIVTDRYSRSAEWTTTSTTWQQGAAVDLSLGVKDIFFGFVYVLVEGYGFVECRGPSQLSEGPRVVA